jgi:serine/threonine protein kinase
MVERFRREAKTIASLRHPAIVQVHGVGRAEDLHYFIMEYIDGVSVGSMLRSFGPLSIPAIRAIMYQVGSALSYAHRPARGVIHRDIKPGNIMLDSEGNAFLTDFGISKAVESQAGLTLTGLIIGTPEYMSPEQCRGDKITAASDQYALGAVVYAMLTGAPPFTGPHYRVMSAHTSEPPTPVQVRRQDCPFDLASGVERMLAKLPEERWPDVMDAIEGMGARPLAANDPIRDEIRSLVRTSKEEEERIEDRHSSVVHTTAPASPTWLRIDLVPDKLEKGEHIELVASAGFADGTESDSSRIRWESTAPSIARVDPNTGELVAVGVGRAVITASTAGITQSVTIEIEDALVARLDVQPSSVELKAGSATQLSATPRGRRGQALDRPVQWSSSDPTVATAAESGWVIAHKAGAAKVIARCQTAASEVVITVVPAAQTVSRAKPPAMVFVSLAVLGVSALLLVLFKGFPRWDSEALRPEATQASDPTVASLVIQDLVRRQNVPETIAISLGETLELMALPHDSSGGILGNARVIWQTSDSSKSVVVASVDSSGNGIRGSVTAVAPGLVRVSARAGSVMTEFHLNVQPRPASRTQEMEVRTVVDQLMSGARYMEAAQFARQNLAGVPLADVISTIIRSCQADRRLARERGEAAPTCPSPL